jgi:hypothetical protein
MFVGHYIGQHRFFRFTIGRAWCVRDKKLSGSRYKKRGIKNYGSIKNIRVLYGFTGILQGS